MTRIETPIYELGGSLEIGYEVTESLHELLLSGIDLIIRTEQLPEADIIEAVQPILDTSEGHYKEVTDNLLEFLLNLKQFGNKD